VLVDVIHQNGIGVGCRDTRSHSGHGTRLAQRARNWTCSTGTELDLLNGRFPQR